MSQFLRGLAVVAVLVTAGCAPAPGPALRPSPFDTAPVPSIGCGPDREPGLLFDGSRQVVGLSVGGFGRWAFIDLPEGAATGEPAPLLVSLHPFATTPEGWDQYSSLAAEGTARGYIVVTPRGSDPGPRWAVPGGLPGGPDDLTFIADLVSLVDRQACVDRNRVFAAGFSAGAAMSVALGCTYPTVFSAVVASGGANLTSTCEDITTTTDTVILHGTNDPIAPPSGSTVVFAPPLGLSIDTVLATTALRGGCTGSVDSDPYADVRVTRWAGCAHRLEYWAMVGSGHTWAGSDPLIGQFLGGVTSSFSATTLALDFFDRDPGPVPT